MADAPPDHAGVRVFPPLVAIVAVLAGWGLSRVWPWQIAPASWAKSLRLGGLFLMACWLGLAIGATGTFRRAGTTANPSTSTTAIATGGPFGFTRNPMYLGLVLFVLGSAFVLNTWWLVLFAVASFVVLERAVIAYEERYLERKFGETYLTYKRRVRRWI